MARRARGVQCSTEGKPYRLPVMQPIGSQTEATPTTGCDSAENLRPSGRSVPRSTTRSLCSRRCAVVQLGSRNYLRHTELHPWRSQIRETLDANRQRESKWTTNAELGLLMELWDRMARRKPRTFDFAVSSHETGEMVKLHFSKDAVKSKLKQLKKLLREERYYRLKGNGLRVIKERLLIV